MTNKKIYLAALIVIVTNILTFIAGSMIAHSQTKEVFATEIERADANVALGHYIIYRDIASNLKSGQFERAQCLANMMATTMSETLKGCLSSVTCKVGLIRKATEDAPEMVGTGPVPFVRTQGCQ